jgi:lysine 2,3-aminomutase
VTRTNRPSSERTVRTIDRLVDLGLVAPRRRAAVEQVAEQFAVAITPAVLETIATGDACRAVARQFVPDARELEITPAERLDPIGDGAHEKVRGVIHRYPDRVLLNAIGVCAVYCRYCFRREAIGPGTKALSERELEAAFDYIRANEAIWEVILSGGDPLMLKPLTLARIAGELAAMPHVGTMRVHTRVPVAAPGRVDADMIDALRVMRPTWVVLHVNHADELSPAVRDVLARLADAGLPLLSQSVLLKGVNDDAAGLARLFRVLVENRVKPYYLHHLDQGKGTSHFRVPIGEGREIMRELRGRVSGLCQPAYVLDIPGGHGKVPIGPDYLEFGDAGGMTVTDPCGCRHRLDE